MGQHELFENKSESFSAAAMINNTLEVKRETIGSRLKSFNLEKKNFKVDVTGFADFKSNDGCKFKTKWYFEPR